MQKKLFFLWVVLAVSLGEVEAQKNNVVSDILSHSLRAYEKLTTLSARQTVLLGSSESGVNLWVGQLEGQICLKKVAADTALGWYFVNEFRQGEMGYRTCYAGDKVETFDLRDSVVQREGTEAVFSEWGFSTFDDWKNKVRLYLDRLSMPDSVFKKQEEAWLVGEVTLGKDIVIDNRPCYIIENLQTGERPKIQVSYWNYERLAIDKKTWIPVFEYTHFQRNVADKPDIDQETQKSLSGWKVNCRVDDSIFRIPAGKPFAMREEGKVLAVGDIAPDFCLAKIQGDSLSLCDLTKKRTILEFAYIACGACVRVGQEIQHEVLNVCDSSQYDFICINPQDDLELMSRYVEAKGITYPYLKGDSEMEKRYGIPAYPYVFVLDESHRILQIFPGYFPGIGVAIRELIENNK